MWDDKSLRTTLSAADRGQPLAPAFWRAEYFLASRLVVRRSLVAHKHTARAFQLARSFTLH